MTPAEQKAEELYNKFYGELYVLTVLRPRVTIQCAINCVDEKLATFFEIAGRKKEFWSENENDKHNELLQIKQALIKMK